MRRTILGGCFFWFSVILSATFGVIFMLVPLLPVLLLNEKVFRRLVDFFIASHLVFLSGMLEIVYGVKVIVSGDRIEGGCAGGDNLIIMNHRTRLDWFFFWPCLYRHSHYNIYNHKISLKNPLKNLPGLGWATQFAAFIFMKRELESDKATISRMLNYYRRVDKDINLVYFVEGTDKCPNSTERSRVYAEKFNLPQYEYCLHPRVTGFSYVWQRMLEGKLDSLYDVSVGYRHTIPQNEAALVKGAFPQEVHFHIKRYTRESLPSEEEELQDFCKDLWKAKEDQLQDFYTKDHKFASSDEEGWSDECDTSRKTWQIIALGYYLSFTFIALYTVLTSTLALVYFCICFVGLIVVGLSFDGLDQIQAKMTSR